MNEIDARRLWLGGSALAAVAIGAALIGVARAPRVWLVLDAACLSWDAPLVVAHDVSGRYCVFDGHGERFALSPADGPAPVGRMRARIGAAPPMRLVVAVATGATRDGGRAREFRLDGSMDAVRFADEERTRIHDAAWQQAGSSIEAMPEAWQKLAQEEQARRDLAAQ